MHNLIDIHMHIWWNDPTSNKDCGRFFDNLLKC